MADQRNDEREEPQRTSVDEERIRGIADQERDEEFEEDGDLGEDEADEDDSTF